MQDIEIAEEAADLTEQLLKDRTLADVYDTVIIPALSMAEEGRHAGFLEASVEEYFFENTRDLVEDLASQHQTASDKQTRASRIVCLPAQDQADEIAARMLVQLLPSNVLAEVLPFDMPMDKALQFLSSQEIDVVCVSGVPPQTTRHVALRCKQLRRRFPQLPIVAAVWSTADLASIRSRIPVTDATHVACTLKQALDYLVPNPDSLLVKQEQFDSEETPEQNSIAGSDLSGRPDTPLQDVLDYITREAARAFDAPIAILNLVDEQGQYWSSECGMPADLSSMSCDPRTPPNNCIPTPDETIIIQDILAEDWLANPFLIEKGIRFYADAPLLNRNGKTIGSLRICDTRPRPVDEQAKDRLRLAVSAVLEALEIRSIPLPSVENFQAMQAEQNSA